VGRIVREEDGGPVPNAAVLACPGDDVTLALTLLGGATYEEGQRRAVADGKGRFRITGLSAGTWSLVARGPGRGPAATTLAVPRDREMRLSLPAGAALVVTLRDPSGAPVPGTFTQVILDGGGAFEVRTGDDGIARYDGLPAGRHDLEVGGGDWSASARIEVRAGEETRVRLGPPAGEASVTGTLTRDGRGLAAERLLLIVRTADEVRHRFELRSDDAGRYAHEGLPTGTARLTLPGTRARRDFEIRPGENVVDLEVPVAKVRFRVVDDATGEPVSAPQKLGPGSARVNLLEPNVILVRDLEPTEQTLEIQADGYAPVRVRFTPTAAAPEVEVRMVKGYRLALRAKAADGRPVADPDFALVDADGWRRTAYTAGEITEWRLAPGSYSLTVAADGFATWEGRITMFEKDREETITLTRE
jgi:hypothetical protein